MKKFAQGPIMFAPDLLELKAPQKEAFPGSCGHSGRKLHAHCQGSPLLSTSHSLSTTDPRPPIVPVFLFTK